MDENKRQQYRTVAWIQIFALVLMITGCGDAGTSNGSIRGQVFSNRSGGALTKTPEAGVSVVAVFDGEPERVRNAVTDGNGQYVIPDLPIGKYRMGYIKDGFDPITTEKGTSDVQSAVGDGGPTIIYVDSGSTVTVGDITLVQKAPEGDGIVIINLIDETTGEPVNGATVTVGEASTSNGSNGQYVLTVPVRIKNDTGAPGQDLSVTINVDGYERKIDTVQALAGQTTQTTIRLNPITGFIQGTIILSRFNSKELYNLQSAQIYVDGIPGSVSPQNDEGFFSLEVPVRTDLNNRSYTIRVKLKGFFDQVVNNVLAPEAGAVEVNIPPLLPETVTVIGDVVNPVTRFAAVVEGIGLEGGVTGPFVSCPQLEPTQGTFSIDGVPTYTLTALKVSVTTYECSDNQPPTFVKSETDISPVNNGTGVFRAGTISGGGGN